MDKLTRRNIRYICFRLQTEAEGGNNAKPEKTGAMRYVEKVKKQMESQDEFGGWKKFGKTWDVDEKAQLVAVNRTSSIQTEWNKILKKQAKELPTTPSTHPLASTPPRGPGGKFVSKKSKKQTQILLPPEPVNPPATEMLVPKPPVAEEKKSFWKRLV